MSLINTAQTIKRQGLDLTQSYRAQVIENRDPKHLGRIKFKIPNFFSFSVEDAPWAICSTNDAGGAGKKYGSVNIPRIDSWVDITFQNGSVYHPVYKPTSIFQTVRLEKSQVNYPDRKIFMLSNGCYIVIDEHDNMVDIFNPGDVRITINGSVGITVKGTLSAEVTGNTTLVVKEGDINATAQSGNITVETVTGDAVVSAGNNVEARGKKILLVGESGLNDSSQLGGVVTSACVCAFTNQPHGAYSQEVFATKGGV